jgi:hypothetical protein
LSRHAVILAEGLPCESYLDTGNRSAFADASGEGAAPGDGAWRALRPAGVAHLHLR